MCLNQFRRNIKETADADFLRRCRFDPSYSDGLYCPIFSLGHIVGMIGGDTNFTDMSIKVRSTLYSG